MLAEEVFDFLLSVHAAEKSLDFDFTLKLHEPVEHRLRSWRASGDIHIDREDFIHSIHHAVGFLERTAADCATAACDDVFGLCKLVVEAHEGRCHLVHDGALNHYVVSLAGGVAGNLETEACHVVARSAETHEFDGAAAGAEAERPQGVGDAPVDKLVEFADGYIRAGGIEFFHKSVDVFVVLEVLSLHRLNFHIFYIHLRAPFRQAYARPKIRINMKIAMQRRPEGPRLRMMVAHG